MQIDRFFCAAASRANGEALHGTVARIRSWLLIEYPGPWRPDAVEESPLLPSSAKEHIRKLERSGAIDRCLLIRREHTPSPNIRCFFVESCAPNPRITKAVISSYDELCELTSGTETTEGLMYAVCTHGRHDKCCAKFGIPVFCAFRDQAGPRAWQCSHVGGDRFAANVVIFPHGIYYGRVMPEEVQEVVRRSESGEIWLERYRGRSCFPRAIQIAEYFLRRATGKMGIDEFQPLDTSRADTVTRVRFTSRSDRRIQVIDFRAAGEVSQPLTCSATDSSTIPQYELVRYIVEER
jgi:hypothetical protein